MEGVWPEVINDLRLDSREVQRGDVFVAIKGAVSDGHQYVDKAIENGAAVVVCEQRPILLSTKVTYVITKGIHENLWKIAADFYGDPSAKLKLVGVTGTNGKTTVATMFYNLMSQLNVACGLISTVKICYGKTEVSSKLTTPDVVTLNRLMSEMCQSGCTHVVMEVSSHAIEQERIKGLHYDVGVFTNLTHDHLDYHKTFKAYLNVKKKFFDRLGKNAFVLTNVDDRNGLVMVQNTQARKHTYALRSMADYRARIIAQDFEGMELQIDAVHLFTSLIGLFNVYNLLAVIGVADLLDFDKTEVYIALSKITSADGRFDVLRHDKKKWLAIVDYAHTPDALENVLKTIKELNRLKGKVITVVGCGGDRDTSKRPKMASIAAYYSDLVVLTSDNPRTEDPEDILDQMEAGVNVEMNSKILRITNRKQAIKAAVKMAEKGSIILVAGKGHETYQEIHGVRHPFDDKKIIQEFLYQDI